MKIVALLNWYDEKPDWLAATVASISPFVDEVVAVDGAYMMYPGGRAKSPDGQGEAVRQTARACGMGLTLYEPRMRWAAGEVEKRAFMFTAGEAVTCATDWYFVVDGDEIVTDANPGELRERLPDSEHDAARVTSWVNREQFSPTIREFRSDMVEEQPVQKLFRAVRGLTVVGNHWTYQTPDGRRLWGKDAVQPLEVPTLRVEHRKHARDLHRGDQAKGYYQRREELELEVSEDPEAA